MYRYYVDDNPYYDLLGKRKRRRRKPRILHWLFAFIVFILAIVSCIAIFKTPVSLGTENILQTRDEKEQTTIYFPSKDNGALEKEYNYAEPVPLSEAVADDYFKDAVFIGDSRTEGLLVNTGLSDTIAYTYKGLTVDTVFTQPAIVQSNEKVTIIEALRNTTFTKAYIALGINETGWPYRDVFIEHYKRVIDEIQKINPQAIIYVQQIIPVSDEVSANHSYIKNEKIKEYNDLIQAMAEQECIYYLDVASVLVDKDGALPEEAATDGIHLKKAYCEKWLDYLKNHTVG